MRLDGLPEQVEVDRCQAISAAVWTTFVSAVPAACIWWTPVV
jgi:hypothetical protein